jgi:hypothetical protein
MEMDRDRYVAQGIRAQGCKVERFRALMSALVYLVPSPVERRRHPIHITYFDYLLRSQPLHGDIVDFDLRKL